MPTDRRRDWLQRLIREKVAAALEQAPEEIGTDRPLSTLGVDSITAMEIKWAVEDGLGVTLPMSSLEDGPSIAALVDRALAAVNPYPTESVGADGADDERARPPGGAAGE
jgi:acyl carrier protein